MYGILFIGFLAWFKDVCTLQKARKKIFGHLHDKYSFLLDDILMLMKSILGPILEQEIPWTNHIKTTYKLSFVSLENSV